MDADEKAAHAAVDEVIRENAVALGIVGEDHLITSWMLVGCAVHASDEDLTCYFRTYSGGSMPNHVALGLLEVERHRLLTEDMGGGD